METAVRENCQLQSSSEGSQMSKSVIRQHGVPSGVSPQPQNAAGYGKTKDAAETGLDTVYTYDRFRAGILIDTLSIGVQFRLPIGSLLMHNMCGNKINPLEGIKYTSKAMS